MIRVLNENKKILTERVSNRRNEYEEYLEQHISGVKQAYEEFKDKLLTETDLTVEELSDLDNQIAEHDASKYEDEEFYPYLYHFYPSDAAPDNKESYDAAWNHHQKHNPHHWQYWILYKDSGSIVVLDMPEKYVIEMLSDWHSFSKKDPSSTAYSWWTNNREKMVMSDNTIALVEKYIEYFKEPLK